MKNKTILSLLVCLSIFFIGCGSSSDPNVVTGQQAGLGDTAPGTIFAAGTGAVTNQQDATSRILSQVLGLNPNLIRAQASNSVVVGQGEAPLVNLYSVPEVLSRGTSVSSAELVESSTRLTEPYYLFWLDANPLAARGHASDHFFVRVSDGQIRRQLAYFDPQINGERPLDRASSRAANLAYTHEAWADSGIAEGFDVISQTLQRQIRAQAIPQPGGYSVGGLSVIAHHDMGGFDSQHVAFLESMGIPEAQQIALRDDDRADNRLTFDEINSAISEATAGLGPDDKFVLILSSHGAFNGTFQVGNSFVNWEDLCRSLNTRVTAGNINVIADSCFSGIALDAFADWSDLSDKRIKVNATTDAEDLMMYRKSSRSDGTGLNLECTLSALDEALEQNENPTLDQLEQAFCDATFSAAELKEKLCEYLVSVNVPQAQIDRYKADYDVDDGIGDPARPSKHGGAKGFDERELGNGTVSNPDGGLSPEELELIQKWIDAFLAGQNNLFIPIYAGDYSYDWNNFNDAINFHQLPNGSTRGLTIDPVVEVLDEQTGTIDVKFEVNTNETIPSGQGFGRATNGNRTTYIAQRVRTNDLKITHEATLEEEIFLQTDGNTRQVSLPAKIESVTIDRTEALGVPFSGFLNPVATLSGGQQAVIEVTVPGVAPFVGANEFGRVFVNLGDQQGIGIMGATPNVYTAVVTVPSTPGVYLLRVSAANTTTNGENPQSPQIEFAQAQRDLSIEVEVGDR